MENTMSFQFSDLLICMYVYIYIYIYKVKKVNKVKINIIKTEIIDLHYLQ